MIYNLSLTFTLNFLNIISTNNLKFITYTSEKMSKSTHLFIFLESSINIHPKLSKIDFKQFKNIQYHFIFHK